MHRHHLGNVIVCSHAVQASEELPNCTAGRLVRSSVGTGCVSNGDSSKCSAARLGFALPDHRIRRVLIGGLHEQRLAASCRAEGKL